MHIHLDPLGGIAGDMFVASLLDAMPDLADGTIKAVRQAGLGDHVRVEHLAFRDDVLTGSRFVVSQDDQSDSRDDSHDHVHWRHLRNQLVAAPLPQGTRDRAIAIFSTLAEAEAAIHGVPVDEATFHEVGAWDSVADIVAAAHLIEASEAKNWSVGPLPLGRGVVQSAHGELPIPAPATLRLLKGYAFHDDGRPGERVTPTGAAILKHLQPSSGALAEPMILKHIGYGFGLRRLDGMSNILRASVFQSIATDGVINDRVGVVSFEIDDQTAEDLAIGLDHLRSQDDILDILQMPAFGKKGRVVTALRLLVRPEAIERVIDSCFQETTTLGIRWSIEDRVVLERRAERTKVGTRIKIANRPDGSLTAKAESDDLKDLSGHQRRQESRKLAEASVKTSNEAEH